MKYRTYSPRAGGFRALALALLAALWFAVPSSRAQTGAGTALVFDGVNDYVSISNSAALNAYPLTVMGWFRNDDFSPDRGLVNKYAGNSFNGYQIYFYEGTLYAWYFRTNSSYIWDGARGLNGGFLFFGWSHVAFTVDATGGKLYVNGVLRDSRAWTGTPGATTTTQEMRLGRYDNSFWRGAMDEVSIWNVALPSNAIVSAMNRPLATNETGLIAYWRFEEAGGNSIADLAPAPAGNNRGTLFGGPAWESSGAPIGPEAQTREMTRQTITGATLTGNVLPRGRATTAWFEWGTNTSYGNVTPIVNVGSGSINVQVDAAITGLGQGQTYHYRVVATNADGLAVGLDRTFTQLQYPGLAGTPTTRSTSYDGSFSQVAYEARPEWDGAVPMTVEAWVYRRDANRFETIVSHGPDSYRLGFSPRLRFYRGTNYAEIPTPVPAFKWTHIAVSYDGAIARFYINGEFAGGRTLSNNGAGKVRQLLLGYGGYSSQTFFPVEVFLGNLDEVRLWSVARSATDIREGMYQEVRGEPGLAAACPWGGRVEVISGQVGYAGNVTEQIFGMVPRDLVVPRAALQPVANGQIDLASEYLGAEQLVIRYPDDPTVADAVAFFVHTDDDLFVGIGNQRPGANGSDAAQNWLGLFLDTAYARPALAQQAQVQMQAFQLIANNSNFYLNGDGNGGFSSCFTTNFLTGIQPCTPANLWQIGKLFCGFELAPPCVEFRVSRSVLGSFDEFDGVAFGHFNYGFLGEQAFTPEEGFSGSPATWLKMSYGQGSANLPRVRISGRVFGGVAVSGNPPLAGHRVSFFSGGAAYSQLTDAFGRYSFDVPMPTGQVIYAQVDNIGFGRYRLPAVSAVGVQPIFVFTNDVRFPAIASGFSGTLQLAGVDFFVQKPLLASGITSATPISPICGSSGRIGEPGGPGEIVTLFGTNLHAEMEFYLSPYTTAITPSQWHLIRAEVLEIAPDRTWVKVQTPFVPEQVPLVRDGVFVNAFESQWRWVSYDGWFRPGAPSDSYFGQFGIKRPPYPLMHGFSFDNQGADPALNEFLACYGYNAYLCVGAAGVCASHVPDPLYWAIWWPVYYVWIGGTGGSCVGMASTAMQLHSGALDAGDFDPLALTAIGIDNPGFPGEWDTGNTGGRYTRPPIPKDVWARVRMNHGIQTSIEYIITGLNQLDLSFSSIVRGDPVARLNEMRDAPTLYTISMVPEPGSGHCVSPYRIEDNYGGDPNISRIWIYDNEDPCARDAAAGDNCVTGQFIDINRSANTYSYNSWSGTALFATPHNIYNGERHAPFNIPLFDIPRLMLIIAGGADGHYSISNNSWGWRADGTFVDNFPGLAPVTPLGSPDNQTRSVPVFLPLTISNAMPAIDINVRDTNAHVFHAAANGTLLQLEVSRGQPSTSNQIRLGAISNQLASFQFRPQVTISNFIPRIGFTISNSACATFQWLGLDAVGNKTQEFRALKSQRAVDYRNDTGKPTQHYLRIDAVDGTSSNNTCAIFGPFNVPAGAVHCVVLHDWPRARQVRSELDLNGDGTPDQVTIITGTEIDSDGDGMPDAWETLHQLDPESIDCDNDADKDGVSNLGEYLTDTDPRDPNSALRLTATMLPGNKVRLSWKAVPGRRYEILYANSFEYVFQPLTAAGLPRIATATTEHFDDTLPAGATRARFYQLRLAP